MTISSKIYSFCLLGLLLPICAFNDQIPPTKKYFYKAYLGCSEMGTTTLSKDRFDSLIAIPLCAKDSNQNIFPIQNFEITYAERGLYQDSAGLPIIFTDYSNVRIEGNTVTKLWVDLFKERSYKGDTIYIDNVKVRGTDNRSYQGKGLKIIIQ